MNEPRPPRQAARAALNAVISVPPDVVNHSVWQMRGGLEYETVVEPAVWAWHGDITGLLAGVLRQEDYPGKAGDVERLRQFVRGPTEGAGGAASMLLERADMVEFLAACDQPDMADLVGCELPPGFGWLVYVDARAEPETRLVVPLFLGPAPAGG